MFVRRTLFLSTIAALACIVGPSHAADAPYDVGVAKLDVTPDYPVRMSGYSNRSREFDGVEQPIFAKALAVRAGKAPPLVLVTVDSLGVPASLIEKVAERLAKSHRLPRANFAICATHTHSAPATTAAKLIFPPPVPSEHIAHIERYTEDLTQKIGDVAERALGAMRPGRLSWGVGKANFAVNRRVLKDGRWTGFGVVPDGAVDHALPVLFVHDVDDAGQAAKLRAVLVNYACHCTTLGGNFNKVHGDWAGCAAEQIEREQDGATALISIGCGADANPNPRTDDLTVVRSHGDEVAREVARLLKASKSLKPLTGEPSARLERFDLPLAELPTKAEFEERLKQKGRPIAWHAQAQLDRLARGETLPTAVPYSAQAWTFGDALAMVFLPGEVVVDYQLRLKRELHAARLWINAYANASPCYIASRRVLAEGGYEVDGSMYYYDQPQHFAPEVEETLIAGVRRVVLRSFDAAERFAADVAKIEARDRAAGLPSDPILFLGSSTIVRWNLDRWFSDLPVVNHGFGGSMISDSVYYFDRLVMPVKPRQIVFFAGGNDLNAGKTPEQVFDDFVRLAKLVRERLPQTRLTYLAITPTPKRWSQIERQRDFNGRVEREIARMNTPLVEFVKLEARFLDAEGRPQPHLFVEDRLHLNESGYAILVDIVRPRLK